MKPQARTVVGVLRARSGAHVIEPFEVSEDPALEVKDGALGGAAAGDAVVAEIGRPARAKRGSEKRRLEARIVEVLGPLDAPGVDVEIVVRRRGIRRTFPEAVRVAAAKIERDIPESELAKRERFADPAPVTIDGETARDFDDAIAVAQGQNGGLRLFVHVADVGYYVAPGDAIDREAQTRGTSVYFPDRVYPMVPQRLSDDLCSLRPGQDRLVQSVILDVDRKGKVVATRFADGLIRSAARLTYTQVASLLDGEPRPEIPPAVAAMLRRAETLRVLLERQRRARGSIDFDLPAPTILLDVEGAMTGIKVEPRNRAHRMIEEFMLAANEAVAAWLSAKKVPSLFRIHDAPDPEKVEVLESFARSLGLTLKHRKDGIRPADVQDLLEQAEGKPFSPVVSTVALRSMMQARYATADTGHFGLAAPHYLHFTSPIRRYPDLVAHRALRGARHRAKGKLGDLEPIAESCSRLEREAESAERELLEWKKVKYLSGRIGEAFDGIVSGVARFGLFVQLAGGIGEGLLRVERLGGEWFEHDPARHELRSPRGERAFRLGDAIRVVVERVDTILRRVDLRLADESTPERRERPRNRRRRR
jgi:ribonuclease R